MDSRTIFAELKAVMDKLLKRQRGRRRYQRRYARIGAQAGAAAPWEDHVAPTAVRLAYEFPVENAGPGPLQAYFTKQLDTLRKDGWPYHRAVAVVRQEAECWWTITNGCPRN